MAGQYYDDESGLHYNWNRYYDPETGRYISSDPIGLAGGLNTFAYAAANPVMYIDPEGLFYGKICKFFKICRKLAEKPIKDATIWCIKKIDDIFTKNKPGVGGNGAASQLPNLSGKSASEVARILRNAGFKPTQGGSGVPSAKGWQKFKHSDGSVINVNWLTGRVVRTPAPRYNPDGSRIKGERLGPDGKIQDRNIPHDQIPEEIFIP